MGHSTILISLSLVTLLCGLSIAAYQLWSAESAQQDSRRSALAARFGSKAQSAARQPAPTPPVIRDEPRVAPATLHADLDVITPPPPQAENPKKPTRAPRRKPKPDLTQTPDPDRNLAG